MRMVFSTGYNSLSDIFTEIIRVKFPHCSFYNFTNCSFLINKKLHKTSQNKLKWIGIQLKTILINTHLRYIYKLVGMVQSVQFNDSIHFSIVCTCYCCHWLCQINGVQNSNWWRMFHLCTDKALLGRGGCNSVLSGSWVLCLYQKTNGMH